jgi:hypothetical protein
MKSAELLGMVSNSAMFVLVSIDFIIIYIALICWYGIYSVINLFRRRT